MSLVHDGYFLSIQVSSVQLLSSVRLFATPWTAACQVSLSITNSWSLLKLLSIESVMPTNHLIFCNPLLLSPSIFSPSGSFPVSQFFPSGGQNIGVSASTSVLPMTIQDWFHLGWTGWVLRDEVPEVQGTLKSLLQHHSSKASILWHSVLSIVQLSHPYMTTGKAISLTRWTFVGKVMSLLFNMPSRLVITYLPRSKFWIHGFEFHGCSHHLQWFWSPQK